MVNKRLMSLTYKIARLWWAPEGTVEKYSVDEKIEYPNDSTLNFSSNFVAKLQFVKLKNEIIALIDNAKIATHFTCQHCLEDFIFDLKIPHAEGEFFYDNVPFSENEADINFIDKRKMTISLDELVRQEIILHFPLIPVCSRSCKGLCARCGKNKNRQSCKCKEDGEPKTSKPLRNLKKIYNSRSLK